MICGRCGFQVLDGLHVCCNCRSVFRYQGETDEQARTLASQEYQQYLNFVQQQRFNLQMQIQQQAAAPQQQYQQPQQSQQFAQSDQCVDNNMPRCPNCGADGVTVTTERVKPDLGPGATVIYLVALAVILWRGFDFMFRPYTNQANYNMAVAIMAVAVVFAIVITIVFFRIRRKRPCRVQRCPRCGHAVALDKPSRWSKGWRIG